MFLAALSVWGPNWRWLASFCLSWCREEPERFELIQGALVGTVQHADPTTSTEVVGDLHSQQDLVDGGVHCNVAALCTLNG